MHHRQTCTVAQLLFHQTPSVNFARLVADLEAAFAHCPADGRQLNWDYGDMAVLDIEGSRIVMGYEEGLEGDYSACLAIGIGYGPGAGPADLAERQDIVSRLIVGRIHELLQPDGTVWHHSTRDLIPELLDALIEELPQVGADRMAQELTRTADLAASRYAEADAASAQRATTQRPSPLRPANDQPHVLHPHLAELHRVRSALYSEPQAEVQPATLRLAAHAMNATLIVIALPVGAAMMTYSLLRGENLNASARLLAVIGIAIGAESVGVGSGLMQFF